MDTIYVKSLPLRDVVRDLATEMKVEVQEYCDELVIELPKEYGKGFIRGIDFQHGIGLIEYNCEFKKTTQIQFSLSKIHPLKFLFCNLGQIEHYFDERKQANFIQTYQNAIVASSSQNGHIIQFEAEDFVHLNSLEIDREVFEKRYDCSLKNFNSSIKSLLLDKNAEKLFFHQGSYSLKTAEIIEGMNEDKSSDFVRNMRLNAGAFQILAAQIDQYEDDLKEGSSQSVIRTKEIKQVEKLVEEITNDLSNSQTVQQLAEKVHMNANKLQRSFKYLYGDTVNNFIQNLRLEEARKLLRETTIPMMEITDRLGLTNPSYFAKIFKEKYNLTPNQYRKGV